MAGEKMHRVSKQNSCPICGKPDWCLVAQDGSAAICPRIQEGSVKKCGDAGYLHILENRHNRHTSGVKWRRLLKSMPISREQSRDFGQLVRQYQQQLTGERLDALADSLGVSVQSLERLNVGWDSKAYTFPMSNDFGKVIGIQRRFLNGSKVSVKGSKSGLFVPSDLPSNGLLLVCEGATDTAAALDLGFAAIGRPNCNSKTNLVSSFVERRDAVVISDDDCAGKTGAEKLAKVLTLYCSSVKVIYPPEGVKDLRQWLICDLTDAELQDVIKRAKPVGMKLTFARKSYNIEAKK
ncbi:MAG: hypothetical protein ACFFCW_02115 [Candidatus Hodarchaeota archaeon]